MFGAALAEPNTPNHDEPPNGKSTTRWYGPFITNDAVEPLMVSPDAGVIVRVLVEVTCPYRSMTSRVTDGQVCPTQVAPADGKVMVLAAVMEPGVHIFWSVINAV